MNKYSKLYIFTGKGGVGKTTLSLSFCHYLKNNNQKCLYTYIESNKIEESKTQQTASLQVATELELDVLKLNLLDCAREYIAKKLKSKTIASWIVKTPFFQSLLNMIPGFSYVIYMGQIVELMIKDPKLIVVLDSPSSGHAITMLESTKNFNQIFESGLVYEDTKLMLKTLQQENFTKINIIALPSLLALHEGVELRTSIHDIYAYKTEIHCNNCLSNYQVSKLPSFLQEKIKNEKLAIEDKQSDIDSQLDYSSALSAKEVVKDLLPSMENLV